MANIISVCAACSLSCLSCQTRPAEFLPTTRVLHELSADCRPCHSFKLSQGSDLCMSVIEPIMCLHSLHSCLAHVSFSTAAYMFTHHSHCATGSPHQLDCQPCAQAPRAAGPHQCRQEAQRPAPQGALHQQAAALTAGHLEAQQLPVSAPLSLIARCVPWHKTAGAAGRVMDVMHLQFFILILRTASVCQGARTAKCGRCLHGCDHSSRLPVLFAASTITGCLINMQPLHSC